MPKKPLREPPTSSFSPMRACCGGRPLRSSARSRTRWLEPGAYSQIRTLGSERSTRRKQRIADACEAAEQPEIELPLADIPAIVAAGCRVLHDSRHAPRCKFAQVVRGQARRRPRRRTRCCRACRSTACRRGRASRVPRRRARCARPLRAARHPAGRAWRWRRAQSRCPARRDTIGTARALPRRRGSPASCCAARHSSRFRMRCIATPPWRIRRARSPPPATPARTQSPPRRATCR